MFGRTWYQGGINLYVGFQTTRLYLVVKKCNGGMFQSPPSKNAEVEFESNYYTDHENLAKKLFVHII